MIPRSGTHKARRGSNLHPTVPYDSPHLPHDTRQTDPDLAAIVDAWPTLPEPIKAGIVAMVKASGPAVAEDHTT